MDINWRRNPYPLLVRVFISLIVIATLYILIIRPVRIKINTEYIYPIFSELAISHNVELKYNSRRIDILQNEYDVPRGFGIPFGGYFWLPFSLFVALRHKIALKSISLYHLFLTFGPPMLGLLFINGIHLAGILLRLNEIIFHVLFLIFMFVGIKDILKKLRENKKF